MIYFNVTSANSSNMYSYLDDNLPFLYLTKLNYIKIIKDTILNYVSSNSASIDIKMYNN